MLDLLLALLRTPSPAGRTDAVMQLLGDVLADLPVELAVTRRGSLLARLPGESEGARAVVAHADTIGCMVRDLKPNGRLAVVPGRHPQLALRRGLPGHDPDRRPRPHLHRHGAAAAWPAATPTATRSTPSPRAGSTSRCGSTSPCRDAADLAALGIEVGDFVALDSLPIVTDNGYINARHLDGKAGVAAALGALHALCRDGLTLPHEVHLLITIAEEVGQGASHGLQEDVAEMVSLDNAVCAPGNHSIEDGVTIPMLDQTGPFDYHFTRHLCRLCEQHDIPYARDVFRYYRSDVAAALEAGAETRAALVAFGVDASHGAERTHVDSLEAVARLLCAHLLSPLTFARWDLEPPRRPARLPEQPPAGADRALRRAARGPAGGVAAPPAPSPLGPAAALDVTAPP